MKSVPDVVDDSSFGGITREYQVRVDPDKLVSYGLSIAQVEQQLTNANANAGGSFIEQGAQQINVRAVGLVTNVNDIGKTVLKTQNGTALRVRDIAEVAQGPKIRLGQIGKAIHRSDGVVVDDNDVVEGIVFLRKGADTATTLDGIHAMVQRLNDADSPARSEDRPLPGPRRSGALHHAHRAAQSDRGDDPGSDHPVRFSGECAGGVHRRADDSVCAVVCLNLPGLAAYLRQPAFAGSAGLRHGGGWRQW